MRGKSSSFYYDETLDNVYYVAMTGSSPYTVNLYKNNTVLKSYGTGTVNQSISQGWSDYTNGKFFSIDDVNGKINEINVADDSIIETSINYPASSAIGKLVLTDVDSNYLYVGTPSGIYNQSNAFIGASAVDKLASFNKNIYAQCSSGTAFYNFSTKRNDLYNKNVLVDTTSSGYLLNEYNSIFKNFN